MQNNQDRSSQLVYQEVSKYIDAQFPEYVQSTEYYSAENRELPYVHLGNLCLMLFKNLDAKKNIQLVERLIRWADEIFNDSRSELEVVNLFTIEVLESLVQSHTGALVAKKNLHAKSLLILEQILQEYASLDFLEEYRKK